MNSNAGDDEGADAAAAAVFGVDECARGRGFLPCTHSVHKRETIEGVSNEKGASPSEETQHIKGYSKCMLLCYSVFSAG